MSAARTKVYVDIVTKTDGKEPGAGFAKLAVGIGVATVALAGLVKVGKIWSKAASDAAEIGSKYATIFRDISEDAEAMADKFADSFGLAGSTSRELLGNTADLLTGLGFTQQGALELSEQVNTLAADLASFSNFAGGTTGASEALTKALLGEAESAKALGIVINQNTKEYKDAIKFYTEVEGKTLLQAKAFTALQFATEQSGNAIGDVSRTYESTANVMRRLGEAQKEFNEAMGVSVNRVITPFASAMADLIKQMAEARIKTNELKEALDIQSEGGITSAKQTLLILENQRDKLGKIAAAYEGLDEEANTAWQNAIRQVEDYNESLGITDIFLDKAATTEERRNAAIQGNNDALETYAQILKDAMTDEELRLIQIGQELTELKILKQAAKDYGTEWSGIESLIIALLLEEQELLNEKNELLTTSIELSDEENTSFEYKNSLTYFAIVAYGLLADQQADAAEAKKKADEEEADRIKAQIELYEKLAETGLTPLVQAFSNVGDAGANTWEVIKQAGKDAISAVLESLAKLWTARAAASLVALDFIGAAGWFTAAAGAVAASSVVQNFPTGGQFITDGPTMVGNNVVGDNASGQERITVEPLGGGGDTNNNTGQIMILRIGDRDLKAVVQGWINNRGLHSSRGGAI